MLPCRTAAPEYQMLQAGQETQRRGDDGNFVRADAVAAAKTEGAVHRLRSSAHMHGGSHQARLVQRAGWITNYLGAR